MKKRYNQTIYKAIFFVAVLTVSSCKKFVELGPPPTQVDFEAAFKTDASAQSVVMGIYSLASANTNGFLTHTLLYPSISADDVQYNGSDASIQEFSKNAILSTNGYVNSTWASIYPLIKNANNAISGITKSTTLSATTKTQLLGEAKFLRAFFYFELVNLYGDVPLPLQDDFSAFDNAVLPRTTASQVYAQIIKDLTEAQAALPTAYVGTFRGRINKYAVSALLSRVYLYLKDYANAEAQATQVIASGTYSLPAPELAFINNSNEIIWQIANISGFSVTGNNYITVATAIPNYSLSVATYQGFETGDLRRTNWISPKTLSGKTFYSMTKYKVGSGTGNEYNVVLRLAEQYLIRAEARAQLNNLSGAKADLDAVRLRAGLGGIGATLTQTQTLAAVEQERKVEFFGEWGHRWFDLKRTNRADAVLGALRPTTWKSTSVLYPIPDAQRVINTNLTQNLGYN